jgi:hypothetical protein
MGNFDANKVAAKNVKNREEKHSSTDYTDSHKFFLFFILNFSFFVFHFYFFFILHHSSFYIKMCPRMGDYTDSHRFFSYLRTFYFFPLFLASSLPRFYPFPHGGIVFSREEKEVEKVRGKKVRKNRDTKKLGKEQAGKKRGKMIANFFVLCYKSRMIKKHGFGILVVEKYNTNPGEELNARCI